MATHKLYAIFALAVLVCCTALPASAEVAIPGYVSSPSAASSAPEPDPTPSPTAPPDLSDSPLDNATTYTPAEITEILKEHPNAFTTAADPAAASSAVSSSAAEETGSADPDQQQSTEPGTIWLKPFNSYTPAEGYLLLLTVIALSGAAFKLIKYLWL